MARHLSPRKIKALLASPQMRIVVVVLLLVIFILSGITYFILHATGKKITNPEGTVGNTAGNLNNSGLFCEHGDAVYFSNSFDGNSFYVMDPDESNIRQLSKAQIQTILAGGDYIYYFQYGVSGSGDLSNIASRHGFNRCDLGGQHVYALTDDIIITGQLVDDYLYLLAARTNEIEFYKLRCDKSDRSSLANYVINPACVDNGTIYYNGTRDNHNLYTLDTRTDIPREFLELPLWYPVIDGDALYYMDIQNNYRLCRYLFSTQEVEVLTNDRVDCFNVGSGYIYYQKNGTDPQLMKMRADGTEAVALMDGNYTKINMTSRYVYFQDFESGILYHSPIGSDSCSLFTAAQEAAKEKK